MEFKKKHQIKTFFDKISQDVDSLHKFIELELSASPCLYCKGRGTQCVGDCIKESLSTLRDKFSKITLNEFELAMFFNSLKKDCYFGCPAREFCEVKMRGYGKNIRMRPDVDARVCTAGFLKMLSTNIEETNNKGGKYKIPHYDIYKRD